MKIKSILLTAAVTLSLTTATMAQVPNYVPTNGLVGWWPFNGNANDESGNGNNGTVNGATISSDRFGNNSNSFNFNGSNYIEIPNSNSLQIGSELTISIWLKYTSLVGNLNWILQKGIGGGCPSDGFYMSFDNGGMGSPQFVKGFVYGNGANFCANIGNMGTNLDTSWHHILIVYNPPSGNKLFFDGVLVAQDYGACPNCTVVNSPTRPLYIGLSPADGGFGWNGKLDDIGFWNRALTQQEISDLYNAINCANNLTISPTNNQLQTGANANFTATTSDPSPSFVWQSDFGQGYQTLNNFGNYSGANSATLNISNVQLSEHNQPIRVISTSGNCIDTSNVAVINILDTCLVTVYDTLLTTVTDTLVINATITGINPPNNLNTLKAFPNPASTHITIDYGNFNAMSGYNLKIVNSVGQTVFTTPINQQTSYIDLSTWTGNGIYFVQLIDPQNNTIENRKIVIQ